MYYISAQDYFNSFPAETQAEIRASWGGADLLNEWYSNAVAAGAVPLANTPGAGTTTPPPGPGGQSFAQWLRAKAAAENWSEDFKRYSDAQLEAWQDHFDYNLGRFKNDYGDVVEKPIDDGAVSNGRQAIFNTGRYASIDDVRGPGGGGGAVTAAPDAPAAAPVPSTTDPLASGLQEQFQNQQGIFGNTNPLGATSRTLGNPYMLSGQMLEGGGLWWGQNGYNEGGAAPAALEPEKVGNQAYDLAKATGAAVGATPATSTFTPAAWGVGTDASTSPLSLAVAEQFKKRQQTPQWWEGV